jgi:D-glycero-alpha-D-manno-heptose-7-phosphate kinase
VFIPVIEHSGSVRVDLLGGTLDLNPINLILPNVVTLNVATSLKAHVSIEAIKDDGVIIISKDYNSENHFKPEDFSRENLTSGFFDKLTFVALILDHFNLDTGAKIIMKSGSPAGAGLGGSSAMGVTLFAAICKFLDIELDRASAIRVVNGIEARILNAGPAGYQDYYPALYGGILGLTPSNGSIAVEQLYGQELKETLESHMTLVNSDETRLSGINNWEVYKAFFDGNNQTREGLSVIAGLSHAALVVIQEGHLQELPLLVAKEGAAREKLFPGIVSSSMKSLYDRIKGKLPHLGMKVCGAGGGGCFLLIHKPEDMALVEKEVKAVGMQKLPFEIEKPLN